MIYYRRNRERTREKLKDNVRVIRPDLKIKRRSI